MPKAYFIKSFEGNSLKNIDPRELSQIKRAAELNLGSKSEKDYQIFSFE